MTDTLKSILETHVQFSPLFIIEKFVFDYGKEFEAAPRPKKYRRMTPKECFKNAYALRFEDKLNYVEGYCCAKDFHLPILHAWCVEEGTNTVIDPTLQNPVNYLYYGVTIPQKLLLESVLKSRTYGVLDTGRGINMEFMKRYKESLKENL